MQITNRFSRTLALGLVALMLTIIPNMKVYSAMGNYQADSHAITANEQYQLLDDQYTTMNIAVVAAVAVVAAYYYFGPQVQQIDGSGEEEEDDTFSRLTAMRGDYNAHDFSTFDN